MRAGVHPREAGMHMEGLPNSYILTYNNYMTKFLDLEVGGPC